MKKKVFITVIFVAIILFIAGIITNYMDSARVRTGYEPKFCIKTVSYDGNKVTYWGLGYKVIRYVGVSPNEPYKNNIGVKMGKWFMKYELDENNNKKEKREYVKTYNLEKSKNYEFVLYGIKNESQKYTQNDIFENFEIKNIVETDKIGLEQIQ